MVCFLTKEHIPSEDLVESDPKFNEFQDVNGTVRVFPVGQAIVLYTIINGIHYLYCFALGTFNHARISNARNKKRTTMEQWQFLIRFCIDPKLLAKWLGFEFITPEMRAAVINEYNGLKADYKKLLFNDPRLISHTYSIDASSLDGPLTISQRSSSVPGSKATVFWNQMFQ